MMTRDIPPAPDLTKGHRQGKAGYPSRGGKLGPAWTYCWQRLHEAPTGLAGEGREWTDGRKLSADAARRYDLKDTTVAQLLTRMATEGLIERDHFPVQTNRGPRNRTFYRIKP